jgi:hypothetical protein
MAVALVSRSSIKGTLTTSRDGGDATFAVDEGVAKEVSNGTGLDQANAVYVDDFSIAASGTLDIDLAGTLTDAHGNVLVMTAVKEILVKADTTNTNNVVVGNAAATQFLGPLGAASHTVAVKPGGFYHVSEGYSAAGWAVGAGATDLLRLTNSAAGTAVTGTIVIVGEV